MDSQQYSKGILCLTDEFVKSAIERTKGNLQISIPFQEIYRDACYLAGKTGEDSNNAYLEIKYHVRDRLLRNNFIFMNPNDADSIFITQKAIVEFNEILEKKNKMQSRSQGKHEAQLEDNH